MTLIIITLVEAVAIIALSYYIKGLREEIREVKDRGALSVSGPPVSRDFADWGIGRFTWYINGEQKILWDKGSMEVFSMPYEEESDWYTVDYEAWAQRVASSEELERLQSIISESISSLEPYFMVGTYADLEGTGTYKVMSFGRATKTEKNHIECSGINVRIPDIARSREYTIQDAMSALTRMTDTLHEVAFHANRAVK